MYTKNKKSYRDRLKKSYWDRLKKSWQLYVIIALPVAYVLLFSYGPMYGIQIAFKDFDPYIGIWKSPWVGIQNIKRFVTSYSFNRIIWNTISISIYGLIAGMPVPILLAISLNECSNVKLRKLVQTITYAPHFISTVVMVSMIIMFLSVNSGGLNNLITFFGGTRRNFMAEPMLFQTIYVISGIWQGMGYGSIIYLAALTSIDPTYYEAAIIDGATRIKKIFYIDLPCIAPTIIILLILNAGSLLSVGFEKIYLMQNDLNLRKSEIIATYVYKQGIDSADFSYSTAVSLFNSIVNLILLTAVNKLASIYSETSLW